MGMYGMLMPATDADLARVRAGDTDVTPFDGPDSADVQKMWHALHFLFAGTQYETGEAPLSKAILGGVAIGPEDGEGDLRYLSPDEVRSIAAAFAATTFDAVWERFDAETMNRIEIYPQVWDEDETDLRAEIADYYREVVKCYAAAATAGHGVFVSIG